MSRLNDTEAIARRSIQSPQTRMEPLGTGLPQFGSAGQFGREAGPDKSGETLACALAEAKR